MFKHILKRKGQNLVEYALLFAVVISALLATQAWVKGGLSGKLKGAGDDLGPQANPTEMTYNYTTVTNSLSHEIIANGTTTTTIDYSTSNRTGNETLTPYTTMFDN